MFAIVNHIKSAPCNAFLVIFEADGAVGGQCMMWSMVRACTTKDTSLVILPDFDASFVHNHTYDRLCGEAGAIRVCREGPIDTRSTVAQTLNLDLEAQTNTVRRLVVIESTSTLSMLDSFESVFEALLQCSTSKCVHGVISLVQLNSHSQQEIDQIKNLCTSHVILTPAPSLGSHCDLSTAMSSATGSGPFSNREVVHVEATMSVLRNSGAAARIV